MNGITPEQFESLQVGDKIKRLLPGWHKIPVGTICTVTVTNKKSMFGHPCIVVKRDDTKVEAHITNEEIDRYEWIPQNESHKFLQDLYKCEPF